MLKSAGNDSLELRVLVLAPTGKDATLTSSLLDRAGVTCASCRDISELCEQLDSGVGAILLAEEALIQDGASKLTAWLSRQPPWSDVPVLILAHSGANSAAVARAMDLVGNITVLERPMRVTALISAVRSALRGRRRQYQTREHLGEIARSERDLRDFFDNASVGLHRGGPDGVIQQVNETELEMLGYSREEYVGRPIAQFHVDQSAINEILARLWRGETLKSYEARLYCKNGSIKHVLISCNVLWENGRFIHTRCFTRDITDRKAAEALQGHLAAIVSSSDDAIISRDFDGLIITWNAGAERLFGYSAAEVVGRPITLLIPPERRGGIL